MLLSANVAILLNIAVRTTVVYAVLLAGLRLLGKRELSQMATADFVLVLLVANAVQNAMVGPDTTLGGGLVAAAVLFLVNRIIVVLQTRSSHLTEAFEGHPTLLVHEGAIVSANLRREHVNQDEVMTALREHGVDDLQQVKAAVLEVDGTISVIPRSAPSTRSRRRIRHGRRRS